MRVTKAKFKTYKNVFDEFARRNIFKLESEGLFEELKSPIAVGKESNVFTAVKKDGKTVIVKMYRLETCDFHKMYSYIRYDSRFLTLKNQKRQVIFSWVKREFRNLMIARDALVNVPTPLAFKHNILVLEMIGDDSPSRRLKDDQPKDAKKFLKLLVDEMRKLHNAGLVHGDLSEFNILNYNEVPYLIDFSQSTVIKSQNYKELLTRDITNICRFFRKLKVDCDETKMFEEITKDTKNKNFEE